MFRKQHYNTADCKQNRLKPLCQTFHHQSSAPHSGHNVDDFLGHFCPGLLAVAMADLNDFSIAIPCPPLLSPSVVLIVQGSKRQRPEHNLLPRKLVNKYCDCIFF